MLKRGNMLEKLNQKQMNLARKGIRWDLLSAVFWGCIFTVQNAAMERDPFTTAAMMGVLVVPITYGALQDSFSSVMCIGLAAKKGKLREIGRCAFTKPGAWVIVASLFSGPVACTASIASVYYAGSVYPVAISALFPAFGAILSRMVLKENISKRAWIGIVLGVAGSVVIGYAPPAGEVYRNFALGIIFAVIAAVGWGIEGVFSAKGMDYIDPEVASFIRLISSAVFYLVLLVPFVAGLGHGYVIIAKAFVNPITLLLVAVAALLAFLAYWLYYRAIYACGAARSMALYIMYVFVSAIVGVIFGSSITVTYVIGAISMVLSCILIAGKPSELVNLRGGAKE